MTMPFDENLHPRAGDGRFTAKMVGEADGGLGALSEPDDQKHAPGTSTLSWPPVDRSHLSAEEQQEYDAASDKLVRDWEAHRREGGTYSQGRVAATSELVAILSDPSILDGHSNDVDLAEHIEITAVEVAQLARHRHAPGRPPQRSGLDEDSREVAIEHFSRQLASEQAWLTDRATSDVGKAKSTGRRDAYAEALAELVHPGSSRAEEASRLVQALTEAVTRGASHEQLAQTALTAREEVQVKVSEQAVEVWWTAECEADRLRGQARRDLDQALAAGSPDVATIEAHHATLVAQARFTSTMTAQARGQLALARSRTLVQLAETVASSSLRSEEAVVRARSLADDLAAAEKAARVAGRRNAGALRAAHHRVQQAANDADV